MPYNHETKYDRLANDWMTKQLQKRKEATMSDEKTLGQIAFEAYGDNREWKDYRGQPMPPWSDVRQEIRDAWEVAAEAVVKHVTRVEPK